MKKALSLILSALLLVSVFACVCIAPVSAASKTFSLVGRKADSFDSDCWTVTPSDAASVYRLNSTTGNGTSTAKSDGNFYVGSKFGLDFTLKFTSGYNNFFGEYMSVKIGSFEIRICNISGVNEYYAALYMNGAEAARYELGANVDGAYSAKVCDGAFSMKKGGSDIEWTLSDQTASVNVPVGNSIPDAAQVTVTVKNNYAPVGSRYFKDFSLHGSENGDIDGDGSVTSADTLTVRQALIGLSDNPAACDVTYDSCVDALDYNEIRMHVLGMSWLPGYEQIPIKIMCVGDSITAGTGALGAWRYGLFEDLYTAGFNFRLVGSNTTTADYRLPDAYCGFSATGGYTTQDIINNLSRYLSNDFDVFAMMIGTNDYLKGISTDVSLENYYTILDAVFEKNPDALVYISSICPVKSTVGSSNWLSQGINQYLPDIADRYVQDGYSVKFVDNFTGYGWEASDFPSTDTVHPVEKGLRKIGRAFSTAMEEDLSDLDFDRKFTFDPAIRVTSLSLDATGVYTEVGKAKSVTATVSPANATVPTVVWTSANENIATVSANGRVMGVSPGYTTVTARSLDGSFIKNVTVNIVASTDQPGTTVLNEKFSNFDRWTASADGIFTASYNGCSCALASPKGTLTSNNAYTFENGFKIEFDHKVSTNEVSYGDGFYGAISYAGLTVYAVDVNRKIIVKQGDVVLGTYSSVPEIGPVRIALIYKDGTVSASIDGETVVTAQIGELQEKTSNIVYSHTELYRNCVISNFTLTSY